jgi:hypothetical protein
MSNLRTLRQSGVYLESQNLKAQVRYASPLPVIDPRDWQGKPTRTLQAMILFVAKGELRLSFSSVKPQSQQL